MFSSPGISQQAFHRLEDELIFLVSRLSNRQLLEPADDIHAMLRARRSDFVPASPVVRIYNVLNDNRRDLRSQN